MARRAFQITSSILRHAWPAVFLIAWLVAHFSLTFERYYNLGGLYAEHDPAVQGHVRLEYNGGPVRPFLGKYSVIVREFTTGEIACDASSAPFDYEVEAERPDPLTLAWWGPSDPRCGALPAGSYRMKTCWTVVERGFWGLLPSVSDCLETPIFRVG